MNQIKNLTIHPVKPFIKDKFEIIINVIVSGNTNIEYIIYEKSKENTLLVINFFDTLKMNDHFVDGELILHHSNPYISELFAMIKQNGDFGGECGETLPDFRVRSYFVSYINELNETCRVVLER